MPVWMWRCTTPSGKKVQDLADGETNTGADIRITLPQTPGVYYLLGMDVNAGTADAVNAPAAARIEVAGEAAPEEGYLSQLALSQLRQVNVNGTAKEFPMDPAFAASEHTYTVWVPDNQTGTYAWSHPCRRPLRRARNHGQVESYQQRSQDGGDYLRLVLRAISQRPAFRR